MYIVRSLQGKNILHISYLEYKKDINVTDIFPDFNSETMEFGWTKSTSLPEYFTIEKNGSITELSLEEQVKKGLLLIKKDEKIENNKVVEKSLLEQVEEGLIKLDPSEKILNNLIVEKSFEEQIKEGLIHLDDSQKIDGERIVEKSLKELVNEGLLQLHSPFEYIEENEIKRYSVDELLKANLLNSKEDCAEALRYISESIEEKIAAKYTHGYELKITKDYMSWLSDSKPLNDDREHKYKEMSDYISLVKKSFLEQKKKVKKLLESFKP